MSKAIQYFWKWFTDNHVKLLSLRTLNPKQQQHYTFWLERHLQFYTPGIDYLLVYSNRVNEKAQMIITANGDASCLEKIEEILEAAPKLNDWLFTAFVQPASDYEKLEQGPDEPYIFQDITLKASQLKFVPIEYDGVKKIDMVVYLKNYTVYSKNKILPKLIFLITRDLLREKSVYEKIYFVQLAQLTDHAEIELISLYEVQNYIDSINKKC